MKKKIIIITSIVLTIMIIFGIYKYNHKVKPHQYKTDVERQKYIDKFSKVQYPDEYKTRDNASNENAGGITDVRILNRGALMKFKNIDIMLSTDQKIADGIKIIPALYRDTNGYNDDEIKQYFEENKKSIVTILGISTVPKLKEFIKTLSFLKDTTIKEIKIDESSLNKDGNIITFNLVITTTNSKIATYPLKVIANEKSGKVNCLVYWR